MTNECKGLTALDPVQGFIDYVNDVKPYHTKIIEILIEYTYEDVVNATITESTEWVIDIARPADPLLTFACDDGYATRPYGGPGVWPILNPNANQLNTTYQYGFNAANNQFTVPGDRTDVFKPGVLVNILTLIEDYTYLYDIVAVNPGAAGTGSFVVSDPDADFADNHPVYDPSGSPGSNKLIQTIGSEFDDNRQFAVTSIQPGVPVAGQTTVEVAQAVLSTVPGGSLGIHIYGANNSGTFTIVESEFNGGSIDQWPGYPDPNPPSFILGDDPYTIVTVAEEIFEPEFAVNFPATMSPGNKIYVASVRLAPLTIEKVLSYSNWVPDYTATSPTNYENTPDEGINRKPIVGVTLSSSTSPIAGTGEFTVEGNFEISNVYVGDTFTIVDSTNNDGFYTITSITYDSVADRTTFGVQQIVDDATVDGTLVIDIPSNVFIVDGNFTSRFDQGELFIVSGGTYAGEYTTLTSDFVNGKTRIRTTKDIISTGGELGFDIIDTTTGFIVSGDKTSVFTVGADFNVTGSDWNDGAYTVASSTYIVTGGSPYLSYTLIVPNEDFELNVGSGGKANLSQLGLIQEKILGFGETSDFCDFNPEGIVRVQIGERLILGGAGVTLTLSDDLIVYNLENNDEWGYELPISTIFSATEPTILEQSIRPATGTFNDLWYDTDTGILYRWTSCELGGSPADCIEQNPIGSPADYWKAIRTAYWVDTTTGLFYYRTKYSHSDQDFSPALVRQEIDTGWVLYFAEAPGFNDVQPALGETVLIGKEEFTVSALDDTTFTFRTVTQNIDEVSTAQQYFGTNGDVRADFQGMFLEVGDRTIVVSGSGGSPSGSPNNDGVYTIFQVTYDEINDVTKMFVEEPIATSTAGGTYTVGPLTIPGSPAHDDTLIKVYINSVPASFEIVDSTTFTITSPQWSVDDTVRAELYERSRFETNANVNAYSIEPHVKYHNVTIDGSPGDAYILNGGNYISKFVSSTEFDVYEISGTGSLLAQQFPASFPVVDHSIVDATFTINGDYTWLYTPGRVLGIMLSDDYIEYFTIVSSELAGSPIDASPNQTIITVDVAGSPIHPTFLTFNYQLGVIIGAAYDPIVSGAGDSDKTYLVPSTAVEPAADVITYEWIGPLQIVSQALPGSNFLAIVEADKQLNRFGVLSDLTSIFSVNQTFTIEGSTGNDNRLWVIQRVYYDGAGNVEIADITPVGGSPAGSPVEYQFVINGFYEHKFVQGFNFTVSDPIGSPISEVAGNYITRSSTYDENNDQTIIRVAPITPITTNVLNGERLSFSGTDRTYLYVQETGLGSPISFIDETEPLGKIYLGTILPDNDTVLDDMFNIASATFMEDFSFSWGGSYRWNILATNAGSPAPTNEITVPGDVTGILHIADNVNDKNDVITIINSKNGVNDGEYEIASFSYDPITNKTTIALYQGGSPLGSPLTPATLTSLTGSPAEDPLGVFLIENIDITNWFQYMIRELDYKTETITVVGNATGDVQSGQEIRIYGNTNAGLFTVTSSPIYDPSSETTSFSVASTSPSIVPLTSDIVNTLLTNQITVEGNINILQGGDEFVISGSSLNDGTYVVESVEHDLGNTIIKVAGSPGPFNVSSVGGMISYNERGGFVESSRDYGMRLAFVDSIAIDISESDDNVVVTTNSKFFGAWDSNYFELHLFDERLNDSLNYKDIDPYTNE